MHAVAHTRTTLCEVCGIHTLALMPYGIKANRDSASGIGRKLSIIRPGATTVVAPY
jgi:hypothetical protein